MAATREGRGCEAQACKRHITPDARTPLVCCDVKFKDISGRDVLSHSAGSRPAKPSPQCETHCIVAVITVRHPQLQVNFLVLSWAAASSQQYLAAAQSLCIQGQLLAAPHSPE